MREAPGSGSANQRVLSAATLSGYLVRNHSGEDLGCIEELMVVAATGSIAFAVVSPCGSSRRLVAVPWAAMELDLEQRVYLLDVDRDALVNAPSFDEEQWPDFSSEQWTDEIHGFYADLLQKQAA